MTNSPLYLLSSMIPPNIEDQAKNTLAYLSDFDTAQRLEWNQEPLQQNLSKKQLRLLFPIRNSKPVRSDKPRNNNSQLSQRGRTILVPCKVSLESQESERKEKCPKVIKNTKQNFRPYKTIRNFNQINRKIQEKEEDQGVDFMNYWIKHRFEKGSITALVDRLRQKKVSALRL